MIEAPAPDHLACNSGGIIANRIWILRSLCVLLTLWAPGVAFGQFLYWVDTDFGATDRIMRSDLDGDGVVTLVNDEFITAFMLDAQAGRLYWGAGTVNSNGRIMRSDLDGSNIVQVTASGATTTDIAIDHTNNKIYWTDFAQGKIQRSNLDGSGVELLATVKLHVNAITLDIPANRMYYTLTSFDTVWSADLLGQGAVSLINLSGTSSSVARDIALDTDNGKMYFSASGVQRANLDGTEIEVVADSGAAGIAIDLASGHVYWANSFEGKIKRVHLDGGNVQDILTGLDNPKLIALLITVPCPADLNGDGVVDTADLGALLGSFGFTAPPGSLTGDINGDGVVDTADLGLLLAGFGPCPA